MRIEPLFYQMDDLYLADSGMTADKYVRTILIRFEIGPTNLNDLWNELIIAADNENITTAGDLDLPGDAILGPLQLTEEEELALEEARLANDYVEEEKFSTIIFIEVQFLEKGPTDVTVMDKTWTLLENFWLGNTLWVNQECFGGTKKTCTASSTYKSPFLAQHGGLD